MTFYVMKNNAQGVLDSDITAIATTLDLVSGDGANFPSTFPFLITGWDSVNHPNPTDDTDLEILEVTGRVSDTLTVIRGKEGTSGFAHLDGAKFAMLITAGIFDDTTYGIDANTTADIATHAALPTSHGTAGSIVGTSDSQILTNKTINGDDNTITNVPASEVTIVDTGVLITAIDVEGALAENRTAINLNTSKVTNVSTDLSEGVTTETTVDVNSSDGTNATLLSASTIRAGLLAKAKYDEIVANTSKLSGIEALAEVNNISDVDATDLTDAGDSILHYHATDRDRANHTGTQVASTISDFDVEVENNSTVSANTSHAALTTDAHGVGSDYLAKTSKSGQVGEFTATAVVGLSGNVDYVCDGIADDVQIQAAIDYVAGLALTKGKVLLMGGDYDIAASIVLPSFIDLCGIGKSTKLILANGVDDAIIRNGQQTTPGNEHISIHDMWIDGNGDNQISGDNLIKLVFAKHTEIYNIYSEDAYYNNIRVGTNSDYSRVHDCSVVNTIAQPVGISIIVSGNSYSSIDSCYCESSYKHSFSLTNCDHGTINNCIGQDSGNWTANMESGTTNSIISNCVSHNSYAEGFNLDGVGIGCKVVNCAVYTGQTDYGISSGNATSSITIMGCTIINTFKSGISTVGSKHNISNNTIIDCCVDTDEGAFDSQMCGISLQTGTTNCLIQGNNIIDTRGTKKHVYGIGEWGSPTDNYFKNNVIDGFLDGAINKVSDGTIVEGNIGYNPTGNFAAPSVPATTTNYTNVYGYPCMVSIYGGVVTDIDLEDVSTGLTTGSFIIPVGGTINITYSSVPTWKWWGL